MWMPHSTQNAIERSEQAISYDIYLLSKRDIYGMAGYIRGFLEKEERGILSLLSVDELINENILNPNWNIWMALDSGKLEGLLPVQFIQEGELKICHILAINCRQFRKYRKLYWKIEKWAFDMGCSQIRFTGSQSWGRILGRIDYQPSAVVYSKALAKVWGH
jgi:hypothetical protein